MSEINQDNPKRNEAQPSQLPVQDEKDRDIKYCPFCKAMPTLIDREAGNFRVTHYADCFLLGLSPTQIIFKSKLRRWNTRTQSESFTIGTVRAAIFDAIESANAWIFTYNDESEKQTEHRVEFADAIITRIKQLAGMKGE